MISNPDNHIIDVIPLTLQPTTQQASTRVINNVRVDHRPSFINKHKRALDNTLSVNDKLMQTIENVESIISLLTSDQEKLRNELTSIKSDNCQNDVISSLSTALDDAKRDQLAMLTSINELQQTLREQQTVTSSAIDSLRDLCKANDDIQNNKVDNISNEISTINDRITKLTNDVDTLNDPLQEIINNSITEHVNGMIDNAVSDVKHDIIDIVNVTDDINNKLDSHVNDFNSYVDTMKSFIMNLNKELQQSFDDEHDTIDETVEQKYNEIVEYIDKQVSKCNDVIDILKQDDNKQIDLLKNNINDDIDSVYQKLKSTIDLKSNDIDSKQQELISSVKELVDKQQSLSDTVDGITSKQQQIDSSMKDIDSKQQTLTDTINNIDSKQQTLIDIVNNIDSKQQTLSNTINNIDSKQQTLTDTINSITSKQQTLSNTVNDIDGKYTLLDNYLNDMHDKQLSLASTVEDISDKQQTLTSTVNDILSKQESLSITINNNDAKQFALFGSINTLDNKCISLADTIKDINNNQQSLSDTINNMSDKQQSLSDTVIDINNKQQSLNNELLTNYNDLKTYINDKCNVLTDNINLIDNTYRQLQSDVNNDIKHQLQTNDIHTRYINELLTELTNEVNRLDILTTKHEIHPIDYIYDTEFVKHDVKIGPTTDTSLFKVGGPVYTSCENCIYDHELHKYIPVNDCEVSNDMFIVPVVTTSGTWKEFLGICVDIDEEHDIIKYATHGLYMVSGISDTSNLGVGETLVIDNDRKIKILADNATITTKIYRSIVGTIVHVLDERNVMVIKK